MGGVGIKVVTTREVATRRQAVNWRDADIASIIIGDVGIDIRDTDWRCDVLDTRRDISDDNWRWPRWYFQNRTRRLYKNITKNQQQNSCHTTTHKDGHPLSGHPQVGWTKVSCYSGHRSDLMHCMDWSVWWKECVIQGERSLLMQFSIEVTPALKDRSAFAENALKRGLDTRLCGIPQFRVTFMPLIPRS